MDNADSHYENNELYSGAKPTFLGTSQVADCTFLPPEIEDYMTKRNTTFSFSKMPISDCQIHTNARL